jgi:hypothetical protein
LIGASVVSLAEYARTKGYVEQSLMLWPLTAGFIYGALYWFFEKIAWRFELLTKWLRVPNLAGKWQCEGLSTDPSTGKDYPWTGEVTIVQSWDKLRILSSTSQSKSNSTTAALVYDQAEGYRLLYTYRNDPKVGEKVLRSHRGTVDIIFSEDLKTAEGDYFTGYGRGNYGTMKLTKVNEK